MDDLYDDFIDQSSNDSQTLTIDLKASFEDSDFCDGFLSKSSSCEQSSSPKIPEDCSEDDHDMDLYTELLTKDLSVRALNAAKLNEECCSLREQNRNLKEIMQKVEQDFKSEREENSVLKRNISSLFKTAQAEIQRKSKEIASLREELDNIIFRRRRGPSYIRSPIKNSLAISRIHSREKRHSSSRDLLPNSIRKDFSPIKESRRKEVSIKPNSEALDFENRKVISSEKAGTCNSEKVHVKDLTARVSDVSESTNEKIQTSLPCTESSHQAINKHHIPSQDPPFEGIKPPEETQLPISPPVSQEDSDSDSWISNDSNDEESSSNPTCNINEPQNSLTNSTTTPFRGLITETLWVTRKVLKPEEHALHKKDILCTDAPTNSSIKENIEPSTTICENVKESTCSTIMTPETTSIQTIKTTSPAIFDDHIRLLKYWGSVFKKRKATYKLQRITPTKRIKLMMGSEIESLDNEKQFDILPVCNLKRGEQLSRSDEVKVSLTNENGTPKHQVSSPSCSSHRTPLTPEQEKARAKTLAEYYEKKIASKRKPSPSKCFFYSTHKASTHSPRKCWKYNSHVSVSKAVSKHLHTPQKISTVNSRSIKRRLSDDQKSLPSTLSMERSRKADISLDYKEIEVKHKDLAKCNSQSKVELLTSQLVDKNELSALKGIYPLNEVKLNESKKNIECSTNRKDPLENLDQNQSATKYQKKIKDLCTQEPHDQQKYDLMKKERCENSLKKRDSLSKDSSNKNNIRSSRERTKVMDLSKTYSSHVEERKKSGEENKTSECKVRRLSHDDKRRDNFSHEPVKRNKDHSDERRSEKHYTEEKDGKYQSNYKRYTSTCRNNFRNKKKNNANNYGDELRHHNEKRSFRNTHRPRLARGRNFERKSQEQHSKERSSHEKSWTLQSRTNSDSIKHNKKNAESVDNVLAINKAVDVDDVIGNKIKEVKKVQVINKTKEQVEKLERDAIAQRIANAVSRKMRTNKKVEPSLCTLKNNSELMLTDNQSSKKEVIDGKNNLEDSEIEETFDRIPFQHTPLVTPAQTIKFNICISNLSNRFDENVDSLQLNLEKQTSMPISMKENRPDETELKIFHERPKASSPSKFNDLTNKLKFEENPLPIDDKINPV